MIQAKAKIVDHSRAVKKKTDDGAFKSLNQAAGAVRKTAVYSIRRTKKTSAPGTPPNSPSGHLRRVIKFRASRPKDDEQSAEIGATNEFAQTIWDLHEHGGRGRKRKLLKIRRLTVGDYGPIRRKKTTSRKRNKSNASQPQQQRDRRGKFVKSTKRFYVFIKLETPGQVREAEKLQREENEKRANQEPGNYPQRPFMGPALKKMEPRLPAFWRGSVK